MRRIAVNTLAISIVNTYPNPQRIGVGSSSHEFHDPKRKDCRRARLSTRYNATERRKGFNFFLQAQQGSLEQEQEEAQVNHNYYDFIPLSESEDEEEEEEEFSDIEKNTTVTKKLKTWSTENNITQTALKQLLLILNEEYVSTRLLLPKDPRTALQTPKEVFIKNIEGG
ncbi:hypothetical protein EVAR_103062_1 [Eumeta japonica]|uniref:Uncharacterized protein n=1 Tax=Eumeta variegata TaxID=151549 RepID=A0A4C1WR98_EUMVA|nr:hypothetical protein EVAR_103062_1 [Eumeta japonica]